MTGTIKAMNSEKGYGFISAEGMEKDVFFHTSKVKGITFDELRVGDAVTFTTEEGEKGVNAVDVEKAA